MYDCSCCCLVVRNTFRTFCLIFDSSNNCSANSVIVVVVLIGDGIFSQITVDKHKRK